jgi:hypothetical protein
MYYSKKQLWHIHMGENSPLPDVYLDGELISGTVHVSLSGGQGTPTVLTLTLMPSAVRISSPGGPVIRIGEHEYSLVKVPTQARGDLDEGLFGARRINGDAHQPGC